MHTAEIIRFPAPALTFHQALRMASDAAKILREAAARIEYTHGVALAEMSVSLMQDLHTAAHDDVPF